MGNINDVRQAVIDTYKNCIDVGISHQNAIRTLENAFSLLSKGKFNGFTRTNGAREIIGGLGNYKVFEILCQELINNFDFLNKDDDISKEMQEAYYSGNKENRGYREALDRIVRRAYKDYSLVMPVINNIINSEILKESAKEYGMENLEINPENMHKLASGVERPNIKRMEEQLEGNMHAVSDIGNYRKNQEDAFLIMQHPDNPDFKFMVVADGMGGCLYGEIASDIAVKEAREWFSKIDPRYYKETDKLNNNLEISKMLRSIDHKIYKKTGGKGGTTFVCSIIGKDSTVLTNIGDSRAYIVKGAELQQVTEDNSYTYNLWKEGIITRKDDIRFHKDSNLMTQSLGSDEYTYYNNECVLLNNDSYDNILLFSDGVTDCISEDRIQIICRNTSSKDLAKNIVNYALSHNSIFDKNDPEYNQIIEAGKDNTTAAVYSKNNRNGGLDR